MMQKREYNTGLFFERLFLFAFQKTKVGRLKLFYQYEKKNRDLDLGEAGPTKAVIKVLDQQFFRQVVLYGDIGLGESYFLKYWTTPNLKNVLSWAIDNKDYLPTFANGKLRGIFINCLGLVNRIRHLFKPNNLKVSKKNIADHYDLSNEFFKLMLDKTMTYSCAWFKNGNESLYQAQINKFERLCQILKLKSTDHLLEIGSGWGGFAVYAAEKYKCRVDTITISPKQFSYVQDLVKKKGIDKSVHVFLKDYRLIEHQYDKIVSIEMVEALGFKYFDTFFAKCASALKRDGLMAIQCITFPDPHYKTYLKNTDFIQKHIFPGSELLSIREIMNSLERTSNLMIWDIKSLGLNYAETLTKWKENLNKNLFKIKDTSFNETFIRKWLFYLDYCIAGFEHFYLNVNQILFSRPLNKKLK